MIRVYIGGEKTPVRKENTLQNQIEPSTSTAKIITYCCPRCREKYTDPLTKEWTRSGCANSALAIRGVIVSVLRYTDNQQQKYSFVVFFRKYHGF